MKSRVINTKHLIETSEGWLGYTSQLKPSLFYCYLPDESVIWLQSQHTNKMACFKLVETQGEGQGTVWVYKPTEKFIKKFPSLEGKTFTVHFDLWQDTPFARKKRAGLVKKKGWKKKELREKAKDVLQGD